MSKVIETRGDFELVKLDRSWAPWTYQVNRWVQDGKAYGRPGERVIVGTTNFASKRAARLCLLKY